MKKKKDVGLEYVQELGLQPLKSLNAVLTKLTQVIGKEKAEAICNFIDGRAVENEATNEDYNKKFYDLKNQDYETAFIVTGGFDAHIIRNVCNWIDSHRDCFNGTILEIGCDIGIISCFLARAFPNSKIVSIDHYEKSIKIAKELADKLGINNIEFKCLDAKDLNEKFDTVFSCRTVHENFPTIDENHNQLYFQFASQFADLTNQYAGVLSNLVSDDGTLITIERMAENPLLLGWLLSLNTNGLGADIDNMNQIKCRESDSDSVFYAIISNHKNDIHDSEVFQSYCNHFIEDSTNAQAFGWAGELWLQCLHGEYLEGYTVFDPMNNNIARLMLWKKKDDPTAILYKIKNNIQERDELDILDISQMENIKRDIALFINYCLKNSCSVYKVEYNEKCDSISIGSKILSIK